MSQNKEDRIRKLVDTGKGYGLDWVLCMLPENVFYFSGFRTMLYTRFVGVLVAVKEEQEPILIASFIDRRLVLDKIWSPHWLKKAVLWGPTAEYEHKTHWDALRAFFQPGMRLGVDAIQYDFYDQLIKIFPGSEIVNLQDDILNIRMLKDAEEIETIKIACILAEKVMAHVPEWLKEPITEIGLAAKMNYTALNEGAEDIFYPTLVSCGEKILAYHSPPLRRPIKENELIRVAFGLQINGYGSDIVRTFCKGRPPAEVLPLKDAFFETQEALFEMLRPGVTSEEMLQKAGQIYEKRGCLKNWGNSIGHGLALTIHEPPRIAGDDKTVIHENMVLAIEPGLGCPPHGGFSHCDCVRITPNGCERLTSGLRDLVRV